MANYFGPLLPPSGSSVSLATMGLSLVPGHLINAHHVCVTILVPQMSIIV